MPNGAKTGFSRVDSPPPPPSRPALLASSIALILANVVPLLGAVAWGWSVFEIVVTYWAENLIIGGYTLLRMLGAGGWQRDAPIFVGKVFMAGFFTVHYGMFCLVHGFFVFSLLGEGRGKEVLLSGKGFGIALLALVISHGVSFVKNYCAAGEYRSTTIQAQMFAPYPRIVVLHVAILFGAFAIQGLGSTVPLLVILVVGKTAIDLSLHRWMHRKAAAGEEAVS